MDNHPAEEIQKTRRIGEQRLAEAIQKFEDKRLAEAIQKFEKMVDNDMAGVYTARSVLRLLKRELVGGTS